jgi:hypothetical protein
MSSKETENQQQEIFQALNHRIQKTSDVLNHLEELLEKMQRHPEAFDKEDTSYVTQRLAQVQDDKLAAEHELHRRQHLYVNTVKRLEAALVTRMKILETTDSETQVLEENPELMQWLAKKQASMTDMLRVMKDKLSTPLDDESSADD